MGVLTAGGTVFGDNVNVEMFAFFAEDGMIYFGVTIEEGFCIFSWVEGYMHGFRW